MTLTRLGVVAIGRNEGERLKACLRSVSGVAHRVYVDSGSTDGSAEWAAAEGVEVVRLTTPPGFTAARARNLGLERLLESAPHTEFVQMIDGDCELVPGWLDAAAAHIIAAPNTAAVFGRLRERHPQASIYNRMCQAEWDGPIGTVASCGGIALFRVTSLMAAGGYTSSLIAGEEPDLCLRIRQGGQKIERIAVDMAIHDAALMRAGQWLRRAKRGGHAFAELSWRHRASGESRWRRQVASILLWAALIPALAVASLAAGALTASWTLAGLSMALLMLYPLQTLRMAHRRSSGLQGRDALPGAGLLMLGKFAQLAGIVRYHRDRLRGRSSGLVEYKGPSG